jgi:hypothetical protein
MTKRAHRTVRIDESLVLEAEREARLSQRSLAGQFEYWVRLGRGVERNRSFSADRVAQFLAGVAPMDYLSLQEKIAAIRELERMAGTPESRAETAAQLRMERQKAGVPSYSVDERYPDQLVCRYPDGRIVLGHFEGSNFVEDEALDHDLLPKRAERSRSAA